MMFERLCNLVLRLYPSDFRLRYGREMRQVLLLDHHRELCPECDEERDALARALAPSASGTPDDPA